MKKALRIVSIAMPFIVFVLFFIPAFEVGLIGENSPTTMVTPDGKTVSSYAESLFFIARYGSSQFQAYVIAFFCVALFSSLTSVFLYNKPFLMSCGNIISLSFEWGCSSYFIYLYSTYVGFYCVPHAAFYISLILSAFFLAVFVAYAVKLLKARLDSRPPREHKPTKAERIAELEARVRELENRD